MVPSRSWLPDPTAIHDRGHSILAATLELLAEVGYDRLTIDEVAARARASKATVYRRWSGKAELVIAAMRTRIDPDAVTLAETGTLRGDLVALLRQLRGYFADDGTHKLMIGLVNAAEHDEDLAQVLRSEVIGNKARIRQLLGQATTAVGLDPDNLELVSDVSTSCVAVRMMLTRQPVDDEFIADLVDDVMLPLLTRRRTTEPVINDGSGSW